MYKLFLFIFLLFQSSSFVLAYPLDDFERTGISRLEGHYNLLQTPSGKKTLPQGSQLDANLIKLRLENTELELPTVDRAFSQQLATVLGAEAPLYGIALLDLTDLSNPLYAEHNAKRSFNPGSVGKIVVALAVLSRLAELYPDDVASRERILRESQIISDEFITSDSHTVPLWNREQGKMSSRPLQAGDKANMWSYLDYMMSASSNASASMVMKHLLLLKHFGFAYPVEENRAKEFFQKTPKADLGMLLRESLDEPMIKSGLDIAEFKQGGFFTRVGKQRVPGGGSVSTARELLKYLFLLEQGKLVDSFTSLEIKRLLYMTQRRIRYASSPALDSAAVFFKSGSLYRCKPEPEFSCKKYHGNVENVMNSVAIVEYPAKDSKYFYLVSLTSNVLRRNSAVAHQTIATKIQRFIEQRHAQLASAAAHRKSKAQRPEEKLNDRVPQ